MVSGSYQVFIKACDRVRVLNGTMQMCTDYGYPYFVVFGTKMPVPVLMLVVRVGTVAQVPVVNFILSSCTGNHTESNDYGYLYLEF